MICSTFEEVVKKNIILLLEKVGQPLLLYNKNKKNKLTDSYVGAYNVDISPAEHALRRASRYQNYYMRIEDISS